MKRGIAALLLAVATLVAAPVHHTLSEKPIPPTYWVDFNTTKGSFVVEVVRACAPDSADRFHRLVSRHYYDGVPLHRVIPGFVAQFGVRTSLVGGEEPSEQLSDEAVKLSNRRGAVAFARAGRAGGNQVFINYGDNTHLDRPRPARSRLPRRHEYRDVGGDVVPGRTQGGDDNPPLCQEILDISEAQTEAVVELS